MAHLLPEQEDVEDYNRAGSSGSDEEMSSSGDDQEGGSDLDLEEGPSDDGNGASAGRDRQVPARREQRGKRGMAAERVGANAKRRRRREPANIEYEIEQEREDLPSAQQARQRAEW